MICMTWKHADAIVVHTSMVEFVFDYQDVIDNRGLEVWYETPEVIEAAIRDGWPYEMAS